MGLFQLAHRVKSTQYEDTDLPGPASAGSRGTLRMNGVGERKRERESDQTGGAAESGRSLFFTVAFIF